MIDRQKGAKTLVKDPCRIDWPNRVVRTPTPILLHRVCTVVSLLTYDILLDMFYATRTGAGIMTLACNGHPLIIAL